MSRVHEALRRAEQLLESGDQTPMPEADPMSLTIADEAGVAEQQAPIEVPNGHRNGLARADQKLPEVDWRNFLSRCKVIPYRPAPETHLIDVERPHEVPGRSFGACAPG